MGPKEILYRFVFDGTLGIHKARSRAVVEATVAVTVADSVVPADIGRALAIDTTPKHGIKRIDRLLGNENLHNEIKIIYGKYAKILIGPRPAILVDWSKLSGDHQAVISASIVHKGRSIIIYNEVHSMRLLANPQIESKFIDNLDKYIVPEGAKPIIITDAGFRNPWFKKILAKGWDFIGRTSLTPLIRKIHETEWKKASFYNDQKTHEARDYGEIEIAKTNPLRARLITIKNNPKKRKAKARIGKKRISKNGHTANVYRNRYKNVALIITSIKNLLAKSIYKLYSKRMQIEESFRAIKSSRFGYGQENTYTLKHKRLDVIFLLASLAMFIQILLGTLVEYFNLSKHFQSNTQSSKRAISIARLGKLVAQYPKIISQWNITWIAFAIKLSRTFGTVSFILENDSH